MDEILYRHKKRGTVYRILYESVFQYSGDPEDGNVALLNYEMDNLPVVVYQDVNSGKVWVRPDVEFFDGRFEEVTNES